MTARRTSTAAHHIVFDDDADYTLPELTVTDPEWLTSEVEYGKDVCLTLDAGAKRKATREIVAQRHSR